MRWPKAPADLLTEKTFLVIRDNLKSIQEKSAEKSLPGAEKAVAAPTDTWPPKMRKKRPRKSALVTESSNNVSATTTCESSDSELEPRPATASLEEPLVLDPRLVDKLDMSLLSKESLNASLTRINLSLARSLDGCPMVKPHSETFVRSSQKNSNNSISNNNNNQQQQAVRAIRPGRLVCPSPTRASARAAKEPQELDTRIAEATSSPETSAKRLDDNNNKNKQQQLSPLRSRGSIARTSDLYGGSRKKPSPVSSIPTAVSSTTAAAAATPEPCKTCGRACLPERLHSHPKSPTLASPKDSLQGSARSSPSVIPVRTSSHRASLRKSSARTDLPQKDQSPRSDSQSLVFASASLPSTERKILSDDRKINSASMGSKYNEDKPLPMATKRRPRSVTCYICGREFGTASFPIHEPKCLEKWHRENKLLPVGQRRTEPVRPTVPYDHEEWNSAAWQQSQALLVPCPNCKRTFLPDRLTIHARNCRVK